MSCYDVAKMTSLMRSGIANVYVSFSTKNANLPAIVSQKSCIAIDFFIGERVTPHSTLWRMGEAFDARLLKFLCSMVSTKGA